MTNVDQNFFSSLVAVNVGMDGSVYLTIGHDITPFEMAISSRFHSYFSFELLLGNISNTKLLIERFLPIEQILNLWKLPDNIITSSNQKAGGSANIYMMMSRRLPLAELFDRTSINPSGCTCFALRPSIFRTNASYISHTVQFIYSLRCFSRLRKQWIFHLRILRFKAGAQLNNPNPGYLYEHFSNILFLAPLITLDDGTITTTPHHQFYGNAITLYKSVLYLLILQIYLFKYYYKRILSIYVDKVIRSTLCVCPRPYIFSTLRSLVRGKFGTDSNFVVIINVFKLMHISDRQSNVHIDLPPLFLSPVFTYCDHILQLPSWYTRCHILLRSKT